MIIFKLELQIIVKSQIMGKYVRQHKFMSALMKNRISTNRDLKKFTGVLLLLSTQKAKSKKRKTLD